MTNAVQHVLILLARLLLSSIFLISGVAHLLAWNESIQYMQSKGMPFAQVFLFGAATFLLLGGLLILLGIRARLGAVLLIVFLIPTTPIFHNFWAMSSSAEFQQELIQFLKNLAILGGLLMVLGFGSGGLSLDRIFRLRRPKRG